MGLGGLVTGIMGATGNSPRMDVPHGDEIAKGYGDILRTYLASQPDILAEEQQYQPAYTALSLANQTQTRTGNINDVSNLGPSMMDSVRRYNPTVTGTLDTLGSQANEQLKLNGALDPATLRMVQQSTRSAQAARGLGYGVGDAAQEQFYQTQTMEARRAQNQDFAGRVAQQSAGYYGDPYSRLLSMPAVDKTPSIIPSQQSDAMLGTAYNAKASVNQGNANANLAMLQGFNSFS